MGDESPANDQRSWLPEILLVAVGGGLLAIVFGGFLLMTQLPRGAFSPPTPVPPTPLPLLTGPIGGARGKIAFVSGDYTSGAILILDPGSGEIARLTPQLGYYANPTWSPDGTKLAYEGPGPTGPDIFVQRVDGQSAAVNLTSSQGMDSWPVWDPFGTQILFQAQPNNSGTGLYLSSADGKSLSMVVSGQSQDVMGASWSPVPGEAGDRKQIIYSAFDQQGQRLMLLEMDGTSTPVPVLDSQVMVYRAQWSPDGEWIAYAKYVSDSVQLCLIRPDGSDERCLTDNAMNVNEFAWSRDGTRIVFTANQISQSLLGASTISSGMWLINADGTGLTQLTGDPGVSSGPSWSPDGTQIVFSSMRDGPLNIYLINADGTGLTRLTDGPGPDTYPAWSK